MKPGQVRRLLPTANSCSSISWMVSHVTSLQQRRILTHFQGDHSIWVSVAATCEWNEPRQNHLAAPVSLPHSRPTDPI